MRLKKIPLEHFCAVHTYNVNKTFFATDLFYLNKGNQNSLSFIKPRSNIWQKVVLHYISLKFALWKFGKIVIWELQLEMELCTE